jgi:hypothetical protein
MPDKDKLIKELSENLGKCIDYIMRLESISGSKSIDRPDPLAICRLLNSIKNK